MDSETNTNGSVTSDKMSCADIVDEKATIENGNGAVSPNEPDRSDLTFADGTDVDAFVTQQPNHQRMAVAGMPVHKDAIYYNMSHEKTGVALIFNNESFTIPYLKQRTGTQVDCDTLVECLVQYGFDVRVKANKKVNEIEATALQVAREDHTKYNCFLMVILSHGENGIIYGSDGSFKLDHIMSFFSGDNCLTLAGKPKIFIIQACQGDKLDGGVMLARTETDGYPVIPSNAYTIPTYADFLVAYSTLPGYFSWRNTSKGSWFIQALCEEWVKHGDRLHFADILTFVSRRVGTEFKSNNPDNPRMHNQKQIPCITSMLMRFVVFSKKK